MTQPPAPPAPPVPTPPPAPTPPAPPAPPAPAPPADPGFPANTPIEQMTADQRAAYWQHYARKHEDRVKALGNLTAEQLAELRAKADKHDALELELSSDSEKRAAEARKAAAAEADAKYQPLLVKSQFAAAAAGRIEPDKLATILEPLDLSKFLAADGTPDTAKVQAYIDGIAPATGPTAPPRVGPSSAGQGGPPAPRSAAGAATVSAGRDLYAQTHPQKSS